jgi:hypothetical protein
MRSTRAALVSSSVVVAMTLASCGSLPARTSPPADTTDGLAATFVPTATSVEPSASREGTLTYARAVAFWDRDRGLAGLAIDGPDGSSTGELQLTTDGGRSRATGRPTTSGVTQVDVAAATDAWALTSCNGEPTCVPRLYRSTDAGRNWSSAATDLSSVSFVDPLNGWGVAGSSSDTESSLPALERTSDGGRRWLRIASPCEGSNVGPVRVVSFRSAMSGLAVCAFTAGAGGELHAVMGTNDAGRHWTTLASTGGVGASMPVGRFPYGGYIRGIDDAADGTAWIWGDRMMPLATDHLGATWNPLALGDPAANLVAATWPLDGRHGEAVMWAPDQQASLFEVTEDGGRTWTERSLWLVG